MAAGPGAASGPVLALGPRVVRCEPGRPLLMGIVNTNPDSFSDAAPLTTLEQQRDRALAQVRAGADLIDVGGESGVTYAEASPEEVEAARVLPLVEALVAEGVTVSVDTFRPAVAAAAVAAGAAMVNDVSGLADPALAQVCARGDAALVVMHTRAAPKEARFPAYEDVAADVEGFLRAALERARAEGVREEQLVIDPGPDFAKRPAETVTVLRDLDRLRALERPILAAVSRKYFLGAVTGRPPDQRLGASVAAALWAARAGAAILRVHDVADVADALAVDRVLRGLDEVPAVDPGDERLKWIRRGA